MNTKFLTILLTISLQMMHIETQSYFTGKPCINLKGVYSPINVLNNNIHVIVDALDPYRKDTSIEIIDLLFDQRLNRFKFVFKLMKEGKQPTFLGVLTTLIEKEKNEYEQEVIKMVQSPDFADLKDVLIYGKEEQDSKLKCPLLKKHFYQSLRNYLGLNNIQEKKNIPETTNVPIKEEKPQIQQSAEKKLQDQQDQTGLKLNQTQKQTQKMPKTVAEVYQSYDLSVLNDLPNTLEFNQTYNALANDLNQYQNDPVKTEEVLSELITFVKTYKKNNQFNNFQIKFLFIKK